MIHRLLALTAAGLAFLAPLAAPAQNVRPATAGSTTPPLRAPSSRPQQADYIVAVVNSEPITNHDVRQELQRLQQQLAARQTAPAPQRLAQQALENLIIQKAQLQQARQAGIRINPAAVDQAEQNIARQNQMDVPALHRRLQQDGLLPSQFRDQLRDQLLLTRLREQEVESRVRVSDLEVDQYLHEQQRSQGPASQEVNLAHILVAVPETATAGQRAALQARAQQALARVRAGEDFGAVARELSDAAERTKGGELGLRQANRYPPLFLEATQALNTGEVSALLQSGAGFHLLKVLERKNTELPGMQVTQSRARHILLRTSPQLSERAAHNKLREFRQRILAGQADFADLARSNSQDGSAEQGGDLGWASPGLFVPEFEAVLDQLAPGQISEPVASRFGVHLIQLNARRNVTLGPREQREAVRAALREKKLDEAYATWAQDLRARAYVEMREPPQ